MNMLQMLVMLRCIYTSHSTELEDDRKKWFNRIKKHELIHVNLDMFASSNIIEFDAFNNHYKVQLTVNEGAVPIILHSNEDGTVTEQHPTDDDLCYYHGKVLNADSSRVAVSLCEGEGIRGRIHAFGDKLFINPTNFYSAPYDHTDLNDEHLVYKSSDYDWDEEKKEWGDLEAVEVPFSDQFITENSDVSTRRRLADGGQVELFTLIDKTWVDYHGSVSSSVSFFRGVVSDASSLYTNNNLPSDLEISIKYRYAVFTKVSYCNDRGACLKTGRSYMSKYNYNFDYGFYFTRKTQEGGMSNTGGICGSYKHGTSLSMGNRDRCSKVLAHELGHNLMKSQSGGTHDKSGTWIMDTTGGGDTWSSNSKTYLRQNKDKGKWSCLKSTGMSGKSVSGGDYEDNLSGNSGGSGNTDNTGNTGGSSGGSSSGSCLKLYNFKGTLATLNGYWSKSGNKFNQDKSSKVLQRYSTSDGKKYWMVGGQWKNGWCTKTDVFKCGGAWDSNDGITSGKFRSASSCANAYSYPQCFDEYENGMCFYSYSSADAQLFELVEDEGCFNDAPVWRFVDSDSDHMYYLHYNDFDEWVVSDGEMSDFGDFICKKENLYECTDGNWVHDVEYDDEMVTEVVDGVRIEGCGFAKETDEKESDVEDVMIVVVIVLLIGLIVCGGFMFYQHRSKEKMLIVEIGDESEDEAQDGQEITVTTNINTN